MASGVELSVLLDGEPQQAVPVFVGVGGRIGRSSQAELHINHPSLSEFHGYIVHREEGMVLIASSNSPFQVDGERLQRVVLSKGQQIRLALAVEMEVHRVELGVATPTVKTQMVGRIPPFLSIEVRSTSAVTITAKGDTPVSFDGVLGNMLVSMLSRGRPTHWSVLARELWPQHQRDEIALERNWYRNLGRLRKVLRGASLRPDLVRSVSGNVEVFLWPSDVMIRPPESS